MSNFNQVIKTCKLAKGPFPKSARRCDWCAKGLTGRQQRWCSRKCSWEANINHWYSGGRKEVIRRSRATCSKCGSRERIEVNHIKPALGTHSIASCLHHLNNLEAVCRKCHLKITEKQREKGII